MNQQPRDFVERAARLVIEILNELKSAAHITAVGVKGCEDERDGAVALEAKLASSGPHRTDDASVAMAIVYLALKSSAPLSAPAPQAPCR